MMEYKYPQKVDQSNIKSTKSGNLLLAKQAKGICMTGDDPLRKTTVDERLERMIEIAGELSVPLDHVVTHMGRCDQSSFLAFSESPSTLPIYMKSSVTR